MALNADVSNHGPISPWSNARFFTVTLNTVVYL